MVMALSIASIAAAQSSVNFQLGCWGVVSGGGGTRTLPNSNRTLVDSTGQWAVGETSSSSYTIRGGYVQQFGFSASAAVDNSPALIGQTDLIYLPWLSNYIRIVYVCPY